MTFLTDFIGSHRDRFTIDDNNRFVVSFAQISRYHDFIKIVLNRYDEASRKLGANTIALRASTSSGTSWVPGSQAALLDEGAQLGIALHLQIESVYLFAKILLDKIAHSLEFYFGPGRGLSLDSHDDLVKNLGRYGQIKKLLLPPALSQRRCKRSHKKHWLEFDSVLKIKHDPRRRMIARVFLPTRPSVNTAIHEPVRQIR